MHGQRHRNGPGNATGYCTARMAVPCDDLKYAACTVCAVLCLCISTTEVYLSTCALVDIHVAYSIRLHACAFGELSGLEPDLTRAGDVYIGYRPVIRIILQLFFLLWIFYPPTWPAYQGAPPRAQAAHSWGRSQCMMLQPA